MKKWSPETYSKYLYIREYYPNWNELKDFPSYRIDAIYKDILKREEKRKERLKEEQQYHQMTLWEAGLL